MLAYRLTSDGGWSRLLAGSRVIAMQVRNHGDQPVDRFVRTIPYDWLHRCNRLPGKTTTVALALWFLAGVNRNMSFRLTREAVTLAGCSRGALYHGLKALEGAGLVAIQRRPGARPIITINKSPLPVEPEGDHFDLEGILL